MPAQTFESLRSITKLTTPPIFLIRRSTSMIPSRETIYHPGYEEQEIFLLRSSASSIGIFERIVGSYYGVHHNHSEDEDNDAQDKMSSNITVLQGIQLKTVKEFV